MARTDFLRAIHAQNNLVREPVGGEVHHDGEEEADEHALSAAEHLAEHEEQPAHRPEQNGCLEHVRHGLGLFSGCWSLVASSWSLGAGCLVLGALHYCRRVMRPATSAARSAS